MIAKISSSRHFTRALIYNYNKVEQGHASVLGAQKIPSTWEGNYRYGDVIECMEGMIPTATRTKSPVFHCSINPHPDDKLTDLQLMNIAQEYMERMGYGKQPYIVFKHEDIQRPHIHIVASRVDWLGNKISDAFEFRRSKEILQAIELKYGLRSTKKQTQKQAPERTHRIGRTKRALDEILRRYKFQSIGELNAVLSAHGIQARETRKQVRGKQFTGLVYVFQKAQEPAKGKPIRSSEVGRGYGYTAMQQAFRNAAPEVAKAIPTMQRMIDAAMVEQPANLTNFTEALRRRGIELVLRINAQGRIYGATYIHLQSGAVVNGSRIGKRYAANQLNARYGMQPERALSEAKTQNAIAEPMAKRQTEHAANTQHQAWKRAIEDATATAPAPKGMMDTLSNSPNTPEGYRDAALSRKNNRKKRKRRRV